MTNIHKALDTRNGTLTYSTVKTENGFKGQVQHDLHKRPEFKGRVLTRYSKEYKTARGVTNWLDKQIEIQNTPLV